MKEKKKPAVETAGLIFNPLIKLTIIKDSVKLIE